MRRLCCYYLDLLYTAVISRVSQGLFMTIGLTIFYDIPLVSRLFIFLFVYLFMYLFYPNLVEFSFASSWISLKFGACFFPQLLWCPVSVRLRFFG